MPRRGPGRGDRGQPPRDGGRPRARARAGRRAWPSAAPSSSAGSPTASTPRLTRARWRRAASRSRCSGAGWTWPIRAATAPWRRGSPTSALLVSEYWPGTPPAPWRFPARNRVVAGLAQAVAVIEAGRRSGALITADFGLELGRPVLAVPGWPGSVASEGCNGLLRAGAACSRRPADVVFEIPRAPWREEPRRGRGRSSRVSRAPSTSSCSASRWAPTGWRPSSERDRPRWPARSRCSRWRGSSSAVRPSASGRRRHLGGAAAPERVGRARA